MLARIVDATAGGGAVDVEDVTVAGQEILLTRLSSHLSLDPLTHLEPHPGGGDVEGSPVILLHPLEVLRCHQVGDHGELSPNDSGSELPLLD